MNTAGALRVNAVGECGRVDISRQEQYRVWMHQEACSYIPGQLRTVMKGNTARGIRNAVARERSKTTEGVFIHLLSQHT